ncbi:permease [Burkholderia latens]|uniref:permease n=1 Tax=Burkholderia latens TaxID=488446 RepID=UPI001C9664E7|nr:permease [Burkholderia latens]MBY4693040.1 permease [Burkholderia latens]
MNKKEAKTKIAALLSAGARKADVLAELGGQGLKDRVLAHLIASHADPELCRKNQLHTRILVGLGIAQLLISVGLAYLLWADTRSNGAALLFIWGFSTHRVGAYHAFIILSLLQLPKTIAALAHEPSSAVPSLAVTVVLVGYVWFVRNRMFPDFGWFTPRKVDGRYAFVETA